MRPSPQRYIERADIPLVTGYGRTKPGRRCHRPQGLYEWLLWYTTRGECRVLHSKGDFINRPGGLVLIAPDTPQDYGAIDLQRNWECWWVVMRPRTAWKELLDWPEIDPGIMLLEPGEAGARRHILTCLQQAHRFASVHSQRHEDFAMNALESALLWCDTQNPCSRWQRTDPRLRQAVEAVTGDLSYKWTLAKIAGAAGVSEPHVVRLFRRHLQVSPLQYVERRRIERACQLLQHTVYRISEISDQLGFESPFYFSLRFKKNVGVNPRTYRHQAPGTPPPPLAPGAAVPRPGNSRPARAR